MGWQEKVTDMLGGGGLAAAGGAMLTAVGAIFVKIRGQKRIDYQFLLTRLDGEVSELRTEVRQLREENAELKNNLSILNGGYFELPLPVWLKSRDGVYLQVNEAFEEMLLIPNNIDPDQIIGKTDMDIWPDEELSKIYRENDLKVMRTRQTIETREVARIADEEVTFISYKYAFKVNNKVVGVGGVAIPVEDE